MTRHLAASALLALAAAATVAAQAPATPPPPGPPAPKSFRDRLYFGGGIGLGFGDPDYVSIYPQVGFHVAPKLSVGLGVSYVYRSYSDPFDESLNDFGFDVFGRYRIAPPVFAQVQYSYTDFEIPLLAGGTTDDTYSGVLAGGGFVKPLGGRAAFMATALYDFNYSDDEPAPYDDPWIVSVGVTFGF